MKRTAVIFVSILMLFVMTTSSIFAAQKEDSKRFIPKGTVPEFGIVVAWGIDASLVIKYSGNTISERDVFASMYPPHTKDIDEGTVFGALNENLDGSTRKILTTSMDKVDSIWQGDTVVYLSSGDLVEKTFNNYANEDCELSFYTSDASWLVGTECTLTVNL